MLRAPMAGTAAYPGRWPSSVQVESWSRTIDASYQGRSADYMGSEPRCLLSSIFALFALFAGFFCFHVVFRRGAVCNPQFNQHSFRPRTLRTVPCATQQSNQQDSASSNEDIHHSFIAAMDIRRLVIVHQFPIPTCLTQSASLSQQRVAISTSSLL